MSEGRPQDRAFEEFLERRSRVSNAYRDASAERPSAAVDEAILAASRRAVGSGPRRIGWTRRWAAPLAAAAVLVLAVAVVLNLQDEPRIAQLKEAEAPAVASSPASSKQPGERGAPGLADAKREAKPEAGSREVDQAPESGAIPTQTAGKVLADKPSVTAAPQARLGEQARPYSAKESAPERATAPEAAAKSAVAASETARGSDLMESRREPEPTAGANEATALRKQSAAPSAAAPIPPEKLVTRIEALYAQGKTEEADRALRDFCRTFPEYGLPDSLTRHAVRLGLDCPLRK